MGHRGRRLAQGHGHVASARPRPSTLQRWSRCGSHGRGPGARRGGVQSCRCPQLPGQALRIRASFPLCTTRQLDGPFPNGKPSSSCGLGDGGRPVTARERRCVVERWPQGGVQKRMSGRGSSRGPAVRLELSQRRVCTPHFLSPRDSGQGRLLPRAGWEGRNETDQKRSAQRAPGPE